MGLNCTEAFHVNLGLIPQMHTVNDTGGVLVGYAYHVIMALISKCAKLNGKSSILTVDQ